MDWRRQIKGGHRRQPGAPWATEAYCPGIGSGDGWQTVVGAQGDLNWCAVWMTTSDPDYKERRVRVLAYSGSHWIVAAEVQIGLARGVQYPAFLPVAPPAVVRGCVLQVQGSPATAFEVQVERATAAIGDSRWRLDVGWDGSLPRSDMGQRHIVSLFEEPGRQIHEATTMAGPGVFAFANFPGVAGRRYAITHWSITAAGAQPWQIQDLTGADVLTGRIVSGSVWVMDLTYPIRTPVSQGLQLALTNATNAWVNLTGYLE